MWRTPGNHSKKFVVSLAYRTMRVIAYAFRLSVSLVAILDKIALILKCVDPASRKVAVWLFGPMNRMVDSCKVQP